MARRNKNGFNVDGLKELEQALMQLEKRATQRSVMRNALKKAAEPILETADSLVAEDEGDLRKSGSIGTKLNKNQARKVRKNDSKSSVEMHVGYGSPKSHLIEFGNPTHAPQPFMRPAWEQQKNNLIPIIKDELEKNIIKATARQNKARRKK